MAWEGYYSLDGTEIINVSRTEAYVRNAQHYWFKPIFENEALGPLLGDGRGYDSPLLDDAPWTDYRHPASYGFYGCYPLQVTGIEDSSRGATVTESTRDGGTVGRVRLGTKQPVFNLVLLGEHEEAVEYGFRWLKQALTGSPCDPGEICGGRDLCYLSAEPVVEILPPFSILFTTPVDEILDGGRAAAPGEDIYDGGTPTTTVFDEVKDLGEIGQFTDSYDGGDVETTGDVFDGGSAGSPGTGDADGGPVVVSTFNPFVDDIPVVGLDVNAEQCLPTYLRTMREVTVISGPSVTAKRQMADGAVMWTVQFTAAAGDPHEYGADVSVIEGFLDPDVEIPWAGGEIPEGGYIDLDGFVYTDDECVTRIFDPIQDPNCPAILPPPGPPDVPLGCYTPPANWRRRQITIPASYVPIWGEVVPVVEVHAQAHAIRNLRLRFYADAEGNGDISEDPCSYCGDLVFSYIPPNHTIVLDGVAQTVYALGPGGERRRADSLVFRTDGRPFEWPSLTCGLAYVITLDLPQHGAPPVLDLTLVPRAA